MANNIDVVTLQDLCLLTVGNHLSPTNVWSIYRLVPYVHCTRIEKIVNLYICDNFMDISHTNQFLALDGKKMQWLLDNEEIVASEAAVLDGLVRWYKYSPDHREHTFKQLLPRLRIADIGNDVFSRIMRKYKLSDVLPMYVSDQNRTLWHFFETVNIRKLIQKENMANIAAIGVPAIEMDWLDSVPLILNLQEDLVSYWLPLISKSVNFPVHAALKALGDRLIVDHVIPYRNDIFLLGMVQNEGNTNRVHLRLDFSLQTLTHCAPPAYACGGTHVTATCGVYIFFIGVYDSEGHAINTMYRYDTIKDEFKRMTPREHSHPINAGAVVSYRNRYVFLFDDYYCEKYDQWTNSWTPVVPPWSEVETADIFAFGFPMNEKIYVHTSMHLYTLEYVKVWFIYDPSQDTWTSVPNEHDFENVMLNPISCFGQNVSVLLDVSTSKFTSRSLRELHLSTVNKKMYEKEILMSFTEFPNKQMNYFRLFLLSRKSRRKFFEQSNSSAFTH